VWRTQQQHRDTARCVKKGSLWIQSLQCRVSFAQADNDGRRPSHGARGQFLPLVLVLGACARASSANTATHKRIVHGKLDDRRMSA
jgi:hypothetical protein